MDKCVDAGPISNFADSCNIPNLVPEAIYGVLEKLPGRNPPTGWGQGEVVPSSHPSQPASSKTTTSVLPASQTETETAVTTTVSTTDANSDWSYLGCYSDSVSTRALTGVQFADLGIGKVTPSGCMEYCGKEGFSLAGTEYAGQCFCGNKMEGSSRIAASQCDMKCEGDASQICGGRSALSIHEKAQTAASKRSSAHFRRHVRGKHT